MKGKAVEDQHRRRNKDIREKPIIAIDYAFLTSVESDTLPILVFKDCPRGYIKTIIVPRKGTDKDAIEFLRTSIRDMGYGQEFILRSDQELAIVALRERVCEVIGGTPEDAQVVIRRVMATSKMQFGKQWLRYGP